MRTSATNVTTDRGVEDRLRVLPAVTHQAHGTLVRGRKNRDDGNLNLIGRGIPGCTRIKDTLTVGMKKMIMSKSVVV